MSDQCFCGHDAAATCLLCGERRCDSHYFLSATADGMVTTANGVFSFGFPPARTRRQREAFAAGDAACIRCRDTAAAREATLEADETTQAVQAYLDSPSPAELTALAGQWETITEAQAARIMAVTFAHLVPSAEILTLRLALRFSRSQRKASVAVEIAKRESAVRILHMALAPSGEIFMLEPDHSSVSAAAAEIQCLVTPGAPAPAGRYIPPSYDPRTGDLSASITFPQGYTILGRDTWRGRRLWFDVFPGLARHRWR